MNKRRYLRDDTQIEDLVETLLDISLSVEENSHYLDQYDGEFFESNDDNISYVIYRINQDIKHLEYVKDKLSKIKNTTR